MTLYTFKGYKGSADYTCNCSECGKLLKRKAVVENTVNPYNTNADGSVKSPTEVRRDAQRAAEIEAAKLQDNTDSVCKDCDEKDNRELLLAMAAEPERIFPRPENYWSSPMHYLVDRKQVSEVHIKCACGSDCCSGWKSSPGFKITKLGLERAAKFHAKEAA